MKRREFLTAAAAATAGAQPPGLTKFQIACMTLPYAPYPFERALEGIARVGYRFVAWGTTHMAGGQRTEILAVDDPPAKAAGLAGQCRDAGLEPVMMFARVNLEDRDAARAHARRIEQAAAAKIPFVLTFGRTQPGEYENVIRCLRSAGPLARAAGVTVVIKQHGGNTATGRHCSKIIAEVGDEGVKMCYDAGNVLDYENHDPIGDIQACWPDVRAFAIKDHRNTPKDEDCGPGLGEIDHCKLLMPVARTGLTMPLACENIFEPIVPRPATAHGVDNLARGAREFLETVIRGIQA